MRTAPVARPGLEAEEERNTASADRASFPVRHMTIIAVIDSVETAIAAVAELERAGIPREAITIMSGEPVHGLPTASRRRSLLGLFAVAGGLIGAAAALVLTIWPSRRINLMTGGMPIVTPWAFGIVVFELTALGAILFSLGRMIREAGLMRRGVAGDYDEAVADGKAVLAVRCDDDAQRDGAKKVLMRNSTSVRETDQLSTGPAGTPRPAS
ncbi:MAG TPA: quinol:electron acceptor oxidoreductase subunit ActD [Blastocatellia bacterium]|nr:quinol:electron acceptor oxidoreductase subunit ActD [Blastocatellia bacterium]